MWSVVFLGVLLAMALVAVALKFNQSYISVAPADVVLVVATAVAILFGPGQVAVGAVGIGIGVTVGVSVALGVGLRDGAGIGICVGLVAAAVVGVAGDWLFGKLRAIDGHLAALQPAAKEACVDILEWAKDPVIDAYRAAVVAQRHLVVGEVDAMRQWHNTAAVLE